jgi:prepilin-type N-terminal cleavage/methylation domain-containing protein
MNRKGFTLIELLVVIALIAMLTLVITPAVVKLVERNKINTCNSLISSLETAASNYVSDNRYNSEVVSGTSFNITLQTLKDKGYIKNAITNPLVKNDTEDKYLNDVVKVTYDSTFKTFSYEYSGNISCTK